MKLSEIKNLTKAGGIPYLVDGDSIKMLFMITSNSAYGGPDPMIAKGHVDAGESPEQAGIRECEEELGLKKSNIKSLWLGHSGILSGMDATYTFNVYAIEIKSKSDFGKFHYETASTHWLTPEEFASKGRKSQRSIVDEIAKKIQSKHK